MSSTADLPLAVDAKPPQAPPSPPPKSNWDKADIILKPAGGLLTALAVAAVGYITTDFLRSQQEAEANDRLFVQLMSGREHSDSLLRQEMFKTIISDVLGGKRLGTPDAADPAQEILRLEVLAYNFHDALNLAPLFKDLHQRVSDPNGQLSPDRRAQLLPRLERVARDVVSKQVGVLEENGFVMRREVFFEEFDRAGLIESLMTGTLRMPGEKVGSQAARKSGEPKSGIPFQLDVYDVDKEKREIKVRLSLWPNGQVNATGVTFIVGFFDFPMIDNTRVGGGARCSVTLENFTQSSATLTLVYFPYSRASLKEKPYYEEIIGGLRQDKRQASNL